MFENLRFRADLFAVAIWRCCASAQSRRRRACEDRKEARPLLRLNVFKRALKLCRLEIRRAFRVPVFYFGACEELGLRTDALHDGSSIYHSAQESLACR